MSTTLPEPGRQHVGRLDDPEQAALLLQVIHASSAAEIMATGSARRISYRVTRYLLGGATRLGLPLSQIAEDLGVRMDTIRNRINVDGLVTAREFAARASVTEADIDAWQGNGWVHLDGPDLGGGTGYRASELLRALLQHQGFVA